MGETIVSLADANTLCPCGSGLLQRHCCDGDIQLRATVNAEGALEGEPLTPNVAAALAALSSCPDLFPVHIDFAQQRLRLIKMSPAWYQESVFLDPARIRGRYAVDMAFAGLDHWMRDSAPQSAAFIFHTAFCGSTLMSQLLDSLYDSLPLREPEALGNLLGYLRLPQVPEDNKRVTFEVVLQLLSRRYAPKQMALIKANDYCNPLLEEMLRRGPYMPVLFMYVPLEEFVVACLRVPARRDWIRQRVNAVRAAAAKLLPAAKEFAPSDEAVGELAALYWAYNVALFRKARTAAPGRIQCLDFNAVLADPLSHVTACARYFGLVARPNVDAPQKLAQLLGVYSKNNTYRYSPAQRHDDISALSQRYADDIDAARGLVRRVLETDDAQRLLGGHA